MTTAWIVGAGIAGPATAIALHKAGIDVTVAERRHDTDDGGSSFLTLGSNGIDALTALDAGHVVTRLGFETPTLTLVSGTGRVLGDSRTSAVRPDAPVSRTLRRPDLSAALRAEARARGITIETGRVATGVARDDECARVRFADGGEAVADLVVACDGIHSRLRRAVDPTAPPPAYTGLVGLAGYSPAGITDDRPGTYRMIFGRRAFFGYATAPGGDVWWFANVPQPHEPGRGEVERVEPETWRARLVDLFARDAGPATRLVDAATEIMPASPMHTVPRLARWHDGRTVLIGDAAHAPSPSSGQGASLAIEDAVVLARALRDADDVPAALGAFEAARRRRVETIVRQAQRVNGSKAATGVVRVMRDLMLPWVLRATANSHALRETYDHHLSWQTGTDTVSTSGTSR